MQDLSYSDKGRLRNFNAILLNELAIDYSDMDKLKFLNLILLTEFKKTSRKCVTFVESKVDEHLNEETMKEIPTENEIQVPIMNKIEDDFSSSFMALIV